MKKLREIEVGAKFQFRGETFIKENSMGSVFGITNCKDKLGNWVHFSPNTAVIPVENKNENNH